MNQWSPGYTFVATWALAAVGGVASYLQRSILTDDAQKRKFSWTGCIASAWYFGAAGLVLGMLGFEVLGGREAPWRTIACGGAVGLRLLNPRILAGKFLQQETEKQDERTQ